MRNAFISTLCDQARKDEKIWLLCGDLGYSVLEPFIKEFPNRFVNVGVAEQNMIGVAAGLAMTGKTVFVYSIANFPTLRCYEQIRNDVCYHNVNVKIISIGGGLAYGSLGYTHFGIEDLAVMRVLPNMVVCAPGDPVETALITKAISEYNGPCYLRLGKAGEPVVHQEQPTFKIGKALKIKSGQDLCLISTGGILSLLVKVAEQLGKEGFSIEVLSVPTLNPIDQEGILQSIRKTKKILSIEEHGQGGLSDCIAEIVAQSSENISFQFMRISEELPKKIGSQDYLRDFYNLTFPHILKRAQDFLNKSV